MKRIAIVVLAGAVTLGLAGCATSHNFIQPDSHRQVAFSTPISYQEAYRRADAFARQCHSTSGHRMWNGNVSGSIFTDDQSAVVHVSSQAISNADFERFEINGTPNGSDVQILTATNGGWDQHELQVARMSIETGRVTCYGDMPVASE